jgi:hypothetical protein
MIEFNPQKPENTNELKNDLKELSRTEALIVAGGAGGRPYSCWPKNNNPAQTAQDYARCRQNAMNNARR